MAKTVVDTSAWIEFLLDSAVGRQVEASLPRPNEWIAPTIVQYELAKWLAREVGAELEDSVLALTTRQIVVPLDTSLALRAADISRETKLATADAIVYATAQNFGASLLTCDAHFKDLPGVLYVPKAFS